MFAEISSAVSNLCYISFTSLHAAPLTLGARLRTPTGTGPHPAVIILHDRQGPSEREGAYAQALNAAGFVTLEPDHVSPRGATGSVPTVHQTLPDLFGARAFLDCRADVDSSRIGVLGFGQGGAAVLLSSTLSISQAFAEDGGFSGFLSFYPVCHVFNRTPGYEFEGLVAAPIMIATASLDEFDNDPAAGPDLAAALPALDRAKVRTAVFYGVHHGFDVPGGVGKVEDPTAHRGAGGHVTTTYDPEAAIRAHGLAVLFFSEMRPKPSRLRSDNYY